MVDPIIKIFYRPIATYLIVIFNIIIFIIFSFFIVGNSEITNFSECVKNVDASCLRYKDINDSKESKEITDCMFKEFKQKQSPSSSNCFYDFSKCYKNEEIIEKCTSNREKLYSTYGFTTSNINRPHTFITSMFVHYDFLHLIFNMFFLIIAGAFVESKIKIKKFLILYFVSGIIASLFLAFSSWILGQPMIGFGASGAISGILGANLVLTYNKKRSNEIAMLFGKIPTFGFSISFLIIWIILNLMSLIFSSNSGVAYIAHIGGFITGVILISFLNKK